MPRLHKYRDRNACYVLTAIHGDHVVIGNGNHTSLRESGYFYQRKCELRLIIFGQIPPRPENVSSLFLGGIQHRAKLFWTQWTNPIVRALCEFEGRQHSLDISFEACRNRT